MDSSPPPPSFLVPTPRNEQGLSFPGSLKLNDRVGNDGEEGEVSMYVRLFDEMIKTVLDRESYLFTQREIWVLNYILDLPYEPRYLLTRLLLRRPSRVHTYTSLVASYSSEIGEEGIKMAMKTLARRLAVPKDIVNSDPDPLPGAPIASSSRPGPSSLSAKAEGKRPANALWENKPWADSPSGLTEVQERADPELAAALKESYWAFKVGRVSVDSDDEGDSLPAERKRSESVSTFVSTRTVSRQSSGIPTTPSMVFSLTPESPPPVSFLAEDEKSISLDDLMTCMSLDQLRKVAKSRKLAASSLLTRESTLNALRNIAKQQTVLGFAPMKGKATAPVQEQGKQTTLSFAPRPTQTSESLLTTQMLSSFGGSAIRLTPSLHSLISRVNLIFSRTPPIASDTASLMLPSILVTSNKRRYPNYGLPTRSKIWEDRDELLVWERAVVWEATVTEALGETWDQARKTPNAAPIPGSISGTGWVNRKEGAKVVRKIWEGTWDVWKEMVDGDKGKEVDVSKEEGGLVGDRFQIGHVLTRIVYKGAEALGILHEYDNECMVLRALLAQRRWRRGKRGAWYNRLALVLMNHYNSSPAEKEEKLREATQVCIDGLLDEATHLIYRPALSRRLTRLENKLNLPSDERHISYASLLICETRELNAVRLPENRGAVRAKPWFGSVTREEEDGEGTGGKDKLVGKSLWMGKEGEIGVEQWVLEWWGKKGYKGYHSESSILTTLFTLLIWPVLFHPFPGAFETSYQTAPLDLGEDTFAPSRRKLLEDRLSEISKTKRALELLREVDDRERPRGTWAVGVDWGYEKEDLEEILECLGGKALSGVCRMLAEEYRHRASGVPDLIVWNPETKDARFVEVKGPGDSLSETQKIWIDVLLSSGIQVEVCRVKAVSPTAAQLQSLEKKRKTSPALNTSSNSTEVKRLKRRSATSTASAYVKTDEGEYVKADDVVELDEEDDGWERRDEMRFESGIERREGRLE
ncbi:fanconi-associated nuclease 1 [Cryptococcus neoformans Tu259-1]|uniref:Fanconi-associated nuclease n=1 Tax=Cryptococcus neoformans Tu259-1 TaxID=1230072 RepID=A0A854QBK5_CRYNE|nr:fanconi-associated nuclease 1 [Cryptococcus neoformans var. grubii Tu259-1]OXG37737.1 fanconi-associated nuclease 1 [Cryptococcus neoformans var. grubii Bt120]OXG49806.1 fanconi-associated nuclease 1 [Cryptococcus neoformans var. grubii CHC193]